MSLLLEGKVVVITGACGLLGEKFSEVVAESGATVIISDINSALAETRANTLNDKGRKAGYVQLDITNTESISRAISYIHRKYGRIDSLVNNAYPRNKNYGRHFYDVKYQDFCENLSSHLGGYFLTTQKFSEYFKLQGFGNIVSMASIYGVVAPRFNIYENTDMTTPVEYSLIKASVIHLTKYMASYLKGSGVRFNCISPGGIFDGQAPSFVSSYKKNCTSKGMLSVDDVAPALLYLLSDQSSCVNGQNIIIDDGFTL